MIMAVVKAVHGHEGEVTGVVQPTQFQGPQFISEDGTKLLGLDGFALIRVEMSETFFDKECAPHEDRWRQQQHRDRETWNLAGDKGLLCISVPEEKRRWRWQLRPRSRHGTVAGSSPAGGATEKTL